MGLPAEPYRPQFHFTPQAHWMNDPNGLVYFQEEYHLFYQYHPHSSVWGPMHWGHAVSPDLVHWEHLPIALFPDAEGTCWSGCAVVDTDPQVLAILCTHSGATQQQYLATSQDKGRTWVWAKENPVLPNTSQPDFRDPKVFPHPSGTGWVMILAVKDRVHFYQSLDLKEWSKSGEFGESDGSHEGIWECPDLFELPINGDAKRTRWVMTISVNAGAPAGGSGMQYFVGDFDGQTFTNDHSPETVLWVDHGPDFYAAITWADIPEADGRRVWLAWMSNWTYADKTPTVFWRGAMTIPRVLSLKSTSEGPRLAQSPITELQGLRTQHTHFPETLLSADPGSITLPEGEALEIVAQFSLGTAQEFGLRLRVGEGQHTTLGYEMGTQTLFLDRTQSGETGFHPEFPTRSQVTVQPQDGTLTWHVFLDRCSVEVLANGGTAALTALIFPADTGQRLELYARYGQVTLVSLDIYTLGSPELF